MPSTKIFHNQDCSKSREILGMLKKNQISPGVICYLDNPPSYAKLKALIKQLKLTTRDIIRKNEPAYKKLGLDDHSLKDKNLINAIYANPVLIQRPIVVQKDEIAVFG